MKAYSWCILILLLINLTPFSSVRHKLYFIVLLIRIAFFNSYNCILGWTIRLLLVLHHIVFSFTTFTSISVDGSWYWFSFTNCPLPYVWRWDIILSTVKENLSINTNTRIDDVLIHRYLIWHNRLTHSHLLLNKPALVCERCPHLFTVKHILLECNNLQQRQRSLYQSNSLKHLFTSYPANSILQFLRETNVYYPIVIL